MNGMGGTPLIELYIVYRKLNEIPRVTGPQGGAQPVGSYITSLEMAGTSITLLKLDDEMTKLWDAPVKTPGSALGEYRLGEHMPDGLPMAMQRSSICS